MLEKNWLFELGQASESQCPHLISGCRVYWPGQRMCPKTETPSPPSPLHFLQGAWLRRNEGHSEKFCLQCSNLSTPFFQDQLDQLLVLPVWYWAPLMCWLPLPRSNVDLIYLRTLAELLFRQPGITFTCCFQLEGCCLPMDAGFLSILPFSSFW